MMMLWKCCTQCASKCEKHSSGQRTGKGQFSLQSQRKAIPKSVQTTTQLYSFHMLAKQCSKFSKPSFNSMWTENIQIWAGFRKGRGTRDQITNICWIKEKPREIQKNISFTDYANSFDCVDHKTLWKIFKEMRIPDHLPCLLWNLYAG